MQELIRKAVFSLRGHTRQDLHQARSAAHGCNVYSIKYDGVGLLRTPPKIKDLPGFHYGNPVLLSLSQPSQSSEFTFGNKTFKFTPNDGKNFLHGIVPQFRLGHGKSDRKPPKPSPSTPAWLLPPVPSITSSSRMNMSSG
ncbi:MAG: hypothetical protein U0903_02785 [Planctomycetales bacterium]